MRLRYVMGSLPALLLLLSASPLVAQEQDSIVPPRLLNAREVSRLLDDAYPPTLRDAGIGGRARMHMFISAEGDSDTIRIAVSTGLSSLDHAADVTAKKARFGAATLNGQSIGAWVDLDVQFEGRNDVRNRPATIPMAQRDEQTRVLQSLYPADLRKDLIGTSVGLSLLVDAAGSVIDHDIVEPSCFESANDAASSFVLGTTFDPAESSSQPPRHTFATVTFSADTARLRLSGDTLRRDTITAGRTRTTTRAPVLRNRPNVQHALVRHYPRLLRDRGIGGTTTVHFRVEANGRVTYRSVVVGSGYCELDVAALNVASVMRFEPALRDGDAVPVWVAVPIIFSAR